MRDIETIDSEVRLVATLRRAARERGGPLPSIDVADALLDECKANNNYNVSCEFSMSAANLLRPRRHPTLA
jgi:hypothetical protein